MSRAAILILFMLIIFTPACRKDFKEETNPPTINIISPVQGAVYTTGDTVPIKVNFIDDTRIQAYAGNVDRFLPASSIFHCAYSPNSYGAILDTFMVIPGVLYGDYQCIIYCQDPYENISSKTITFSAELP